MLNSPPVCDWSFRQTEENLLLFTVLFVFHTFKRLFLFPPLYFFCSTPDGRVSDWTSEPKHLLSDGTGDPVVPPSS